MRELEADLGVMAYVLQFAPQSFVNIPRYGTIQFHPSLLPRHRGPSSISWPIALGETRHRPHDLPAHRRPRRRPRSSCRSPAPIGPDETLGELYFNKLFPMGVAALLEAADLVIAGRHEERVQDESHATLRRLDAGRRVAHQLGQPRRHVYNLIRACNPAPGAWTMLGGVRYGVYDSRKHAGAHLRRDVPASRAKIAARHRRRRS